MQVLFVLIYIPFWPLRVPLGSSIARINYMNFFANYRSLNELKHLKKELPWVTSYHKLYDIYITTSYSPWGVETSV